MATKKKVEMIAHKQTNEGKQKLTKKDVAAAKKKLGNKLAVLHMELHKDGTMKGDVQGDRISLEHIFRALAREEHILELMMQACMVQTLEGVFKR